MCSPKSLGKNLQNELWARPVASKLSERRPPPLFLEADKENWQKRFFFRISDNYSNAIFKRYPGMPYESWRPAGSENVVFFVAVIFWTRLMDAQSQHSLKFWVCPENYALFKKIITATIFRFSFCHSISHNSGLKRCRKLKQHIFRTGRTSALIWHPWIHLEIFCIGVIR